MTTAHHPHPHPAGHDHHRQHAPESYPHVRGGPTVLDIGGDVGALIAMMDPDTAGTELHLRSEHQPPIDLPIAHFTDVFVTQAGQFGGELTMTGMSSYLTNDGPTVPAG